MTSTTPRSEGVILEGLDGSNPLAFLAALGALRTLSFAWPDKKVRMAWISRAGAWRPVIHASGHERAKRELILESLEKALAKDMEDHPAKFLSGDRKSPVLSEVTSENREAAEWFSALCSDLAPDAASQIQTARRDYFPRNIRSVVANTQRGHLDRALFVTWDYADSLENMSLHVDPSEDRRYAYQWVMPEGDPARKKNGGMLGANRLAIEAFPLFQSFAVGDKLSTSGFTGLGKDNARWTWPIWSCLLGLAETASLLRLQDLQSERPIAERLRARGISAAFRCRRILVGKTPNFTSATAVF